VHHGVAHPPERLTVYHAIPVENNLSGNSAHRLLGTPPERPQTLKDNEWNNRCALPDHEFVACGSEA
jgi:hypothetical protein